MKCVFGGGWLGLRLSFLWRSFLYLAPSDGRSVYLKGRRNLRRVACGEVLSMKLIVMGEMCVCMCGVGRGGCLVVLAVERSFLCSSY